MGFIRRAYDKGEDAIKRIKEKTYNPLREFEKELDNLKRYLTETKNLTAQLMALKIRAEKDIPACKEKIEEYARKAKEAVLKAKENRISEQTSKTLAFNALRLKKSYENRMEDLEKSIPEYDKEILFLKEKIEELRLKIEYYNDEYKFLKSDTKTPINDLFYGDDAIFTRLEKLKNNFLQKNEAEDALKSHKSKLYENIKDVEIYEAYEQLLLDS